MSIKFSNGLEWGTLLSPFAFLTSEKMTEKIKALKSIVVCSVSLGRLGVKREFQEPFKRF